MAGNIKEGRQRLPRWMKMKLPQGADYARVKNVTEKYQLHTICKSGLCPNIGECWGNGTATFMILGDVCTRSCKFCGVQSGRPVKPDKEEPKRLAESIKLMKLNHCVVTSVDRDDLEDKGSSFWASTIKAIKTINPNTTLEVLIPDFDGIPEFIKKVIDAKPEVISHNLETVERLTPQLRSRAQYQRSLQVIKQIAGSGLIAKSGIMLGIGELEEEVYKTMDDLLEVGCQVFTIGQYLQPDKNKNIPVIEYIKPEQFEIYQQTGLKKGFRFVESGPLVRSSYHAERHVR